MTGFQQNGKKGSTGTRGGSFIPGVGCYIPADLPCLEELWWNAAKVNQKCTEIKRYF